MSNGSQQVNNVRLVIEDFFGKFVATNRYYMSRTWMEVNLYNVCSYPRMWPRHGPRMYAGDPVGDTALVLFGIMNQWLVDYSKASDCRTCYKAIERPRLRVSTIPKTLNKNSL